MKFENKILLALEIENLFEKPVKEIQSALLQKYGYKGAEVIDALSVLTSKKYIKFENDKVIKSQKDITFSERGLKLDGSTRIGTIVENEGKQFVKLRGFGDEQFEIAGGDFKDSIGRTCLVDMAYEDGNIKTVIKDVYGFADDPISENIAIADKYGFTKDFPDGALEEAARIPQEVTEGQRIGRVNMENIPFVTIDPKGCKDKDDAVYDEPTERGFKLYVAIADVSSGVLPGTALDKEAFKRGNSAYLGGGVYPMLPPELSNGIFSLDENKPRLAMVVSAEITRDGKVLNPKVENAVINVKKSYSYEEAEKTYLSQDGFDVKNKSTKQSIDEMYKNTEILERMLSKMMNLENNEPAYRFSEDGKSVEEILPSNEEYSHKVIETRMILANEIVAQFFRRKNMAGVFRTHDNPNKEKLEQLAAKMEYYGIKTKLKSTTASYKKLIDEVSNHPAKAYLMSEICRSLPKAKYVATKNKVAHFGLGITDEDPGYMHFTSPIRRYSDLITHRMLKDIILGKRQSVSMQTLSQVASHLCIQERNAEKAEKESDEYLACLWAKNHQGEVLEGYVSQILGSNIKVMASNGTVPVIIALSKLNDAESQNYAVSKDGMKICGKTKTYALGQKIKFKVGLVDLENRTILGDARTKNFEQNFEKTMEIK